MMILGFLELLSIEMEKTPGGAYLEEKIKSSDFCCYTTWEFSNYSRIEHVSEDSRCVVSHCQKRSCKYGKGERLE